MWKVKRMNTARIVVLTIAVGAGGVAAYLASGSDNKPAPAEPVAQMPTVDVLVAKSDIGLGQAVKPEDLQWQTWPAATASNSFIRRNERPDATTQSGTLSLALRSIADVNVVASSTDDQALRRGDSINVVRYDLSTPTTTPK
jgi:Flp pilus assembly protein CpaB